MKISIGILALALVAGSTEASGPTSDVASAHSPTVTRIRVNGDSSDAILSDPGTGTDGFINVGRDRVAQTTGLDFSYVTPTADPDIVILIQGAGEIPNSAYMTTSTTAQLNVVTPFPVIRCEIDLGTAEFSCMDGDPVAFDLTWVKIGFAQVEEHVRRQEKIGPLTVSFVGSFDQRSALVNGTWSGNDAVNISGNLLDTRNVTVMRDITMQANHE